MNHRHSTGWCQRGQEEGRELYLIQLPWPKPQLQGKMQKFNERKKQEDKRAKKSSKRLKVATKIDGE